MEKEKTDDLWLKTLSECNEVQRRRLAGVKALEIGWGGVSEVCVLTGMSHHTVLKGIREVKENNRESSTRLRKEGGGRKKITDKNPKIKIAIEKILEENTSGNPMNRLKWINKSTYAIANELNSKGEKISEDSVARILKEKEYTLQSNKKSKEGGDSRQRDSQFKYINKNVDICIKKSIPVISVDTKKKELIGNFKNAGRKWMKKGKAEIVNVYDFKSLADGKAIPYGVYDVNKNNGFVNVGIDHNTSEFAVSSIAQWWKNIGIKNYTNAKELLICADCGGGNGNRSKLWKYFLQKFSNNTKLKITVCHYPPGTSKWNKIEHKMFSFISMNWRGKPLITYEVIINLIKGTRTNNGLKIDAKLDRKIYKLKKTEEIPEKELEKINVENHSTNSQWNYTIKPS